MNHGQVVFGLAKVAGPNRPKPFDPGDGPLDHLAPVWLGFDPCGDFFLAKAAKVREVGMTRHFLFDAGVVVTLVQAPVLCG